MSTMSTRNRLVRVNELLLNFLYDHRSKNLRSDVNRHFVEIRYDILWEENTKFETIGQLSKLTESLILDIQSALPVEWSRQKRDAFSRK